MGDTYDVVNNVKEQTMALYKPSIPFNTIMCNVGWHRKT